MRGKESRQDDDGDGGSCAEPVVLMQEPITDRKTVEASLHGC